MRFTVEHGRYGPRLVLTGAWDESVRNILIQEGIRELMLNYARGWNGEMEFLPTLDFLEGLVLVHRTLKDDSAVESLRSLRHLQLSTYCSNSIDFSRIPHLKDCGIRWRNGIDRLFESPHLETLFLMDFPQTDLDSFASLSALNSISLSGGKLASTSGIERLTSLTHIGLFHLRRLCSLDGVRELPRTRGLEVEGCRGITNLSELGNPGDLMRLRLDDCGEINSLEPLREQIQLREIFFIGSTTIVDGNLKILVELPRLENISFKNRRHYTHTREEIQHSLDSRSRS